MLNKVMAAYWQYKKQIFISRHTVDLFLGNTFCHRNIFKKKESLEICI